MNHLADDSQESSHNHLQVYDPHEIFTIICRQTIHMNFSTLFVMKIKQLQATTKFIILIGTLRVKNIVPVVLEEKQMSQCMRFPTMWHFDNLEEPLQPLF